MLTQTIWLSSYRDRWFDLENSRRPCYYYESESESSQQLGRLTCKATFTPFPFFYFTSLAHSILLIDFFNPSTQASVLLLSFFFLASNQSLLKINDTVHKLDVWIYPCPCRKRWWQLFFLPVLPTSFFSNPPLLQPADDETTPLSPNS